MAAGRDAGGFLGDGFGVEGGRNGGGGAFEHAAIDDEGEPGGGDVDLGGTGEEMRCLSLE